MLGAFKFDSARCETQCRLCLARIKLLKNKRSMQSRQYRKDIADLLKAGKQDYARIRVEAVIREAATLTGYEILELYLELLAVRGPLVATTKEVPRDMTEAISSILYASTRVPDLAELEVLRKMFTAKYGKEYVNEAINDVTCNRWCVNENLRRCLTIEPPEPSLKLQTLSEIAQEYGVEWDMDRARRELLPDANWLNPPPPGGSVPAAAAAGPAMADPYRPVVAPPAAPLPQPVRPPPPAAAAGGQGPVGYTDVHSAAAAAAVAAAQAAAAADYAAKVAGQPGGGDAVVRPLPGAVEGRPGGGSGGGDGSGRGGGGVVAPGSGWLVGPGVRPPPAAAQGPHQQPPTAPPPGWGLDGPGSGSGSYGSAPAAAARGGYKVKSPEELQAAYDAAVGPPAKGGVTGAGGPPQPSSATAAPGAAGSGSGLAEQGSEGLPSAPGTGGGGSSGSGPVMDEYMDLQKRFEALKRA